MENVTSPGGTDISFKVFYELMKKRISEILLVSSPYDAFIMEEDGRLAERIIHEYRGLNLTRPPRLTWVSTAQKAFKLLSRKRFDLVITMPNIEDVDPYVFCCETKKKFSKLPVFLLSHERQNILTDPRYLNRNIIDKIFIWLGNTDLLLAMIKSWEDKMNVAHDTKKARVRVIILVEDSAIYYSSLLPILYKVIVLQTQAVMEDSLNEEDRILRMRARPKILLAENFEEAENLYRLFKPYLLGVLSDVRFPRNQEIDDFIDHPPVRQLSSTYIPKEHRIRDTVQRQGHLVLTFANILKYKSFPLPEILTDILDMGRKGMGSPVEVEFPVNLPAKQGQKPQFAFLQIRPMSLRQQNKEVVINEKEIADAFCFSTLALGNGTFHDIADILYVKPDAFDPAHTTEIASDIGKINQQIINQNRKYLLIGLNG